MDQATVVLDNNNKSSNTFTVAGCTAQWHQVAPVARNRYGTTYADRHATWMHVTLRNVTVNQVDVVSCGEFRVADTVRSRGRRMRRQQCRPIVASSLACALIIQVRFVQC